MLCNSASSKRLQFIFFDQCCSGFDFNSLLFNFWKMPFRKTLPHKMHQKCLDSCHHKESKCLLCSLNIYVLLVSDEMETHVNYFSMLKYYNCLKKKHLCNCLRYVLKRLFFFHRILFLLERMHVGRLRMNVSKLLLFRLQYVADIFSKVNEVSLLLQ